MGYKHNYRKFKGHFSTGKWLDRYIQTRTCRQQIITLSNNDMDINLLFKALTEEERTKMLEYLTTWKNNKDHELAKKFIGRMPKEFFADVMKGAKGAIAIKHLYSELRISVSNKTTYGGGGALFYGKAIDDLFPSEDKVTLSMCKRIMDMVRNKHDMLEIGQDVAVGIREDNPDFHGVFRGYASDMTTCAVADLDGKIISVPVSVVHALSF